jgi:YggT family protein
MLSTLVPIIIQTIQIYTILLIVRILLSWFPNIDWSNPIFSTLSQLTDPYLNLFRSIIPPLGGLDFSPILAFLLLQFVSRFLVQFAYSI